MIIFFLDGEGAEALGIVLALLIVVGLPIAGFLYLEYYLLQQAGII